MQPKATLKTLIQAKVSARRDIEKEIDKTYLFPLVDVMLNPTFYDQALSNEFLSKKVAHFTLSTGFGQKEGYNYNKGIYYCKDTYQKLVSTIGNHGERIIVAICMYFKSFLATLFIYQCLSLMFCCLKCLGT